MVKVDCPWHKSVSPRLRGHLWPHRFLLSHCSLTIIVDLGPKHFGDGATSVHPSDSIQLHLVSPHRQPAMDAGASAAVVAANSTLPQAAEINIEAPRQEGEVNTGGDAANRDVAPAQLEPLTPLPTPEEMKNAMAIIERYSQSQGETPRAEGSGRQRPTFPPPPVFLVAPDSAPTSVLLQKHYEPWEVEEWLGGIEGYLMSIF